MRAPRLNDGRREMQFAQRFEHKLRMMEASQGGPVCEIYSSKRAVIDVLLIESRCKSRLLINRLLATTLPALPMVINDPSINHLTAKKPSF